MAMTDIDPPLLPPLPLRLQVQLAELLKRVHIEEHYILQEYQVGERKKKLFC